MMWWVKDPVRLAVELEAVENLRASEPWLVRIKETLPEGLVFAIEFDIEVNGEGLPFILKYPSFFPDTPPSVFPRDGRRHSDHQYGAGGELCLEYRSDNWDPAVTGAMMVASTYRLLSGEQRSLHESAVVPDAHLSTLGQELRSAKCRYLTTPRFRAVMAEMTAGTCAPCMVVDAAIPDKAWVAYVTALGPLTEPDWIESEIPSSAIEPQPAVLIRVSALQEVTITRFDDIEKLIRASIGADSLPATDDRRARIVIVADAKAATMYFMFKYEHEWKLLPYRTVDLSSEPSRLSPAHATLGAKQVGIVGAGSLGSKIAVTLARSGVRSFVLVDDDILRPGNLVRHELDTRMLGAHKVDGLKERVKAVAPKVNVKVRRVLLGGQESSATTSSVVGDLASCDLIIETTADPQAFNFAAAAARNATKPLLWTEVYAGGIGGFVGRVRPGIEPPPHTARRQYLAWCREQGVPWIGDDRDYGSQAPEGPPLIADDADVAVIAGHASRMALDTLMRPEASTFPHPAYVIGLLRAWIFEAPLEVRPVDLTDEGTWQQNEVTEEQAGKAIERIISILERDSDADRPGT